MQSSARKHRSTDSSLSETSAFEWGRSEVAEDSRCPVSDVSQSPDYHRACSRDVKTFEDVDQVAIHLGAPENVGTRLVVRRDDGTSLTLGTDRSRFEWVGDPQDSKFEWGLTTRPESGALSDSPVRRLAVFLEK